MSLDPSNEEQPEGEPSTASEPSPPPFNRLVTLLFTWLVILFGLSSVQALFHLPVPDSEQIPRQVASAVQVAERDLEMAAVRTRALAAEDPSRVWQEHARSIERAANVYSDLIELVSERDRPDLLARRAIIEAERGELTAAQWIVSALDASEEASEESQAFANAFRFVYTDDSSSGVQDDAGAIEEPELPNSGWTRDAFLARLAHANSDGARAEELDATIQSRGQETSVLQAKVEFANNALILIGALFALALLKPSFRRLQIGRGIGIAPWSSALGNAVLLRSLVFGIGMIVYLYLSDLNQSQATVFSWRHLWAALPMLFLSWRFLLKPNGLEFFSTFGFRLAKNLDGSRRLPQLVVVTAVLVALHLAGYSLLEGLGSLTGMESRWTDGLIPDMVLGSTASVGMQLVDFVLWAPLFLEVGFRGLLYLTLRTRLQPHKAALASAAIFALLPGSSFPTFLSLFWSGYLLAMSYEKTRSLLPGIFCHAICNLSGLAMLATYR